MRSNLIRRSLAWSFLFVIVINVLLVAVAGTFLGYVGLLLFPGEWAIYANFDVSIHKDLWALVLVELVNVLFYWIIFLLFELWKAGRATAASEHPRA